MTVEEMRDALGLGPDVPDAEVVDLYAAGLAEAEPAEEPVSLAAVRSQLHMTPDDPTDQDDLILSLIVAARQRVEEYTGLILTRRQIVQDADSFTRLRLYAWPIVSVDAITYRDSGGAEVVLAADAFRFTVGRPAQILPSGGLTLPYGREVSIIATAGYETPDDVPTVLKHAILILVSHLFVNREGGDIPQAVWELCRPFKRFTV